MKQYKPRDKITQKMTRDGLVEVNETRQTTERVSSRERDADFSGKKEPEAMQEKPHKQKIRHDPREQPQAEPQKPPEPQNQTAQEAAQPFSASPDTSPLPHAPGAAPKQDTTAAERVMEHIDAAHTRKASKKAARKAQEEAAAQTKSSRLQFTEEELSTPELEKYIEKSNRAADRLDAAKAAKLKENLQTGVLPVVLYIRKVAGRDKHFVAYFLTALFPARSRCLYCCSKSLEVVFWYWSFCHIHSPSYILLFPFSVGYVYILPTIHLNNS